MAMRKFCIYDSAIVDALYKTVVTTTERLGRINNQKNIRLLEGVFIQFFPPSRYASMRAAWVEWEHVCVRSFIACIVVVIFMCYAYIFEMGGTNVRL